MQTTFSNPTTTVRQMVEGGSGIAAKVYSMFCVKRSLKWLPHFFNSHATVTSHSVNNINVLNIETSKAHKTTGEYPQTHIYNVVHQTNH
jgi:hypothetical protein